MAIATNLLCSVFEVSWCITRGCVPGADERASCRILLVNCGSTIPFLRLASRGKQRTTVRQERGVTQTFKATGNGAMPWNSASGSHGVDVDKYRMTLEALVYSGKDISEEKIEKPTGVPTKALAIGNKPMCFSCEAKGAVECPTCTGSGLYVDSILESQGIIVKVKCLGCGGTGSTMCPKCGGRGHAHGSDF